MSFVVDGCIAITSKETTAVTKRSIVVCEERKLRNGKRESKEREGIRMTRDTESFVAMPGGG